MIGDSYEKDYIPAVKLGMQALLIKTYQKNLPSTVKLIKLTDLLKHLK